MDKFVAFLESIESVNPTLVAGIKRAYLETSLADKMAKRKRCIETGDEDACADMVAPETPGNSTIEDAASKV